MAGSLQNTARSRGRRHRHQPLGEINVTPFVDVMLVLLVIFMVTAPLLTTGVELQLPKASTPELQGQDEPLEISITESGQIYLQEIEVDLATIGTKIGAILAEATDMRILVRGDETVDYGTIMQVIAAVHEAGYRNIGLITERP